jgi:hypothetical protein
MQSKLKGDLSTAIKAKGYYYSILSDKDLWESICLMVDFLKVNSRLNYRIYAQRC